MLRGKHAHIMYIVYTLYAYTCAYNDMYIEV